MYQHGNKTIPIATSVCLDVTQFVAHERILCFHIMFCKYKDTSIIPEFKEELEDVEVIVKHEHRRGNTRVSFVREVTVLVYGYKIELLKKPKLR